MIFKSVPLVDNHRLVSQATPSHGESLLLTIITTLFLSSAKILPKRPSFTAAKALKTLIVMPTGLVRRSEKDISLLTNDVCSWHWAQ